MVEPDCESSEGDGGDTLDAVVDDTDDLIAAVERQRRGLEDRLAEATRRVATPDIWDERGLMADAREIIRVLSVALVAAGKRAANAEAEAEIRRVILVSHWEHLSLAERRHLGGCTGCGSKDTAAAAFGVDPGLCRACNEEAVPYG